MVPLLMKLNNNSRGKDKGNHYNVGGFIRVKIMLIYIKFSFDFLGLGKVDFQNYFANNS
jgi:hypothetical protein